jgi:hypothetical protein
VVRARGGTGGLTAVHDVGGNEVRAVEVNGWFLFVRALVQAIIRTDVTLNVTLGNFG